MGEYFSRNTDESIGRYLKEIDSVEKHRIFDEEIRPPFEKLIESLINIYGFKTIDDVDTLKRECLAHLYEMLPKFDPEKGKKGFSYFNVVAKNWFIHRIREKKKRGRLESDLFYDLDREAVKYNHIHMTDSHEDEIVDKEFWIALYKSMDKWHTRLDKEQEKKVLQAVIFIMRNTEFVPMYNRKAAYIFLRDLTGLTTEQVVVSLKKIKDLYREFKDRFDASGDAAG